MTYDSWVNKENIEKNAPEVLAMYKNTLANTAKCMLQSNDNDLSSAIAY